MWLACYLLMKMLTLQVFKENEKKISEIVENF